MAAASLELTSLRAFADEWRSDAARHHHALADALDRGDQPVLAAVFRQIAFDESGSVPAGSEQVPGSPADIRDGLRRIEVMFDRFDDIAAQTGDAAILDEAQSRAEDCVRWLALAGGAWRSGQP